MTLDGFVLFDKKSMGEPRITISKPQITFNVFSCRQYEFNKFKSVVLYFDKEKQSIGFKFLEHLDDKIGYKLTLYQDRWAIVTVKSFLKKFNIKPQKRIKLSRSDTEKSFYIAKLEQIKVPR